MDKTIALGKCAEITITPKPVFNVKSTKINLTNNLSEKNNKCTLSITVFDTSISGNINGVRIIWLFKDESGNLIATHENKDKISLTKNDTIFSASNILVPVVDILKSSRKKMLGKKGVLSAQIIIDNIDDIIIPSNTDKDYKQPFWDATFTVMRTIYYDHHGQGSFDADFSSHIIKNQPAIGEPFYVKILHGDFIPESSRFFISVWENDFTGLEKISSNYKIKSKGYSSMEIRKSGNDKNTGASFKTLTNKTACTVKLGCDSDGKLNYYDKEEGSPDFCEFNYMIGFSFNDENINDFVLLKEYKNGIQVVPDCIRVKTPQINTDKYGIKKGQYKNGNYKENFYVFAKVDIKNLSLKFEKNIPLLICKKNGEKFKQVANISKCSDSDWSFASSSFNEQNNKLYKEGWIFANKASTNDHYAIFSLSDLIDSSYGDPVDYFMIGILNGGFPVQKESDNEYVKEKLTGSRKKYKYNAIAIPLY
jgi:hypothetical protein